MRALVGDADPNRVFGATEVPHILANRNVTTVEGIPRETLLTRQSTHGTQAAFEMIAANSREHVARLRVPVDTPVNQAGELLRDERGRTRLDSREYFAATQIESKAPAFTAETRPLIGNMYPPTEHVRTGVAHLQQSGFDLQRTAIDEAAPNRTPRIGGAGRALGIAGVVLEAYDGAQTLHTANRLRGEANNAAADSALIHFGSRSIGGLGGAAIGAGAGGLATSWSGPGVLIGGGVGGIIGAFGGEKFAQWTDNRSIYNQDDRSGNTWTHDPDQPEPGWQRPAPIDPSNDGIDKARRDNLRATPTMAA